MKVRVLAPGRLHFGLLNVPVEGLEHDADGSPLRPFGGLGLMIDEPFVSLTIEESSVREVTGSLAARAALFLDRLQIEQPWKVHAEGPPQHIGLGVGTALGLSLAKAAAVLANKPEESVFELARRTGRGERSRIGLAGFQYGGFLVDRGHDGSDTLAEQYRFPAEWRIVTLLPKVEQRWHGDREARAFQATRTPAESLATTARLARLVDTKILHALIARDFPSFAASLSEYNRVAGEPFAKVQGGPYSDPAITALIERLKDEGYAGVGQSSWGPIVFALCESEAAANDLKFNLSDVHWLGISPAAGIGAVVEVS
jgi:beta-RFAP synthase